MADVSPSQPGRADPNHRHKTSPDSFRTVLGDTVLPSAMAGPKPAHGHDPAVIHATIARLLASPPFRKSAQLANFLRFVVDETLAGRGGRIKAYTIATAALGRDDTFDPQADPIVRVEAARLRRALRSYYADGGADDAIRIELPTGTYTPVFRPQQPQRPSVAARLRGTWRELVAYARENRRLVLLIFGIAATVSLTVELIEILIFHRN